MKKKLIWTRPVVITCSHCFSSFVCQQVSSGKKLGPVVSFCKLGLLCYLFWIFLFVCAGERWGRVTLLGEGDWTAWLSSARDQWKNHEPLIGWDESHRSGVAGVKIIPEWISFLPCVYWSFVLSAMKVSANFSWFSPRCGACLILHQCKAALNLSPNVSYRNSFRSNTIQFRIHTRDKNSFSTIIKSSSIF